jgi:hypothetical protein
VLQWIDEPERDVLVGYRVLIVDPQHQIDQLNRGTSDRNEPENDRPALADPPRAHALDDVPIGFANIRASDLVDDTTSLAQLATVRSTEPFGTRRAAGGQSTNDQDRAPHRTMIAAGCDVRNGRKPAAPGSLCAQA